MEDNLDINIINEADFPVEEPALPYDCENGSVLVSSNDSLNLSVDGRTLNTYNEGSICSSDISGNWVNVNHFNISFTIEDIKTIISNIDKEHLIILKEPLLNLIDLYEVTSEAIIKNNINDVFNSFFDFYIKNITVNEDSLGYVKHIKNGCDALLKTSNKKMGVELTFHNNTFLSNYDMINLLEKNKPSLISRIYEDCGNVIEMVTKPIPYDLIDDVTKSIYDLGEKYHLTAHDENKGGGGLHFNIDTNKTNLNHNINVARLLHNLPQLNWIFNEPSDNITANSLYFTKNKNGAFNDYSLLRSLFNTKSKAINFRNSGEYYELRFFEMPHSHEEFLLYKEFVIRLVDYCDRDDLFPLIEREISSIGDKLFFSEEKSIFINEFKHLLSELKLNYGDYEHLVERNLNVRFENKLKLI